LCDVIFEYLDVTYRSDRQAEDAKMKIISENEENGVMKESFIAYSSLGVG